VVGSTLNHYRLTKPLGSGGMGDVYLAEDTRLKRSVAIKILPASVASDPARLERFEREAQAVAALNHPNIVTVYSVEQAGDVHFMTMEFVEGRTLADLLPKGGMPLNRLVAIATQLADAVIAAHGRGIIHRDLKPANVMVMAGDRVKVLDFGLAKLREVTEDVAAALPTRELTGEGKIVGTVAYMSPEQAEGKPVDERSDIFSLGVILYELATGTRPFSGDTSLSVLSSILRDTPKNVTELNPALPRDLSRIVRHCLAKEPDRRYQSAKDLRNDLDDLAQSLSSGELDAPRVPPAVRPSRMPLVLTAAAVLVVSAFGAFAIWRARTAGDAVSPLPTMTHSRLTQEEGIEQQSSLSPDGKWIVYATDGDIFLQSVTGQTPINLTKDSAANDSEPAFSPDGESIVFRSTRDGAGIFVMGRTGESVRRLTKGGTEPAWFPDGRRIVYSTREGGGGPENRINFSELSVVSAAGGEPQRLFAGDAVQPQVSPNGKRIAFWALPSDAATRRLTSAGVMANRDIWTIDINGADAVRVTTHEANDWNPVWAPDGRVLYFLSSRSGSMNLWRVGIDETSGVVAGTPQPLTTPAPYVGDFALSADGRIGAYTAVVATRNIARVAFDAVTAKPTGPVEAVTTGAHDFAYIDVTRDGRFIVASSSERGQEDIFVFPASGGSPRQLTNDFARDRAPRWSTDGKIYFYSDRRGYQLWRIDADGSGLTQITNAPALSLQYPVPSPDGKRVAASDSIARQVMVYDTADMAEPETMLPLFPDPTVTSPRPADWSADGRSLAVQGLGGRAGLWIYSFATRTYRRIGDGGGGAAFLADGRRLVQTGAGRLRVIDATSGVSSEVLAMPGENIVGAPRLAASDSQLFFLRGTAAGDLWLVRFGEN
jgi:serine/threonine protein kinase